MMNRKEEEDIFAAQIDAEYMSEAQPGALIINEFMWGAHEFFCDPDDVEIVQPPPSDVPTSIENYPETMANGVKIDEAPPTMKVFITAYYKDDGRPDTEFYLPRERDLILTLVYSPQTYWQSKSVIFPKLDEALESFYVKRKDPEHLGEPILNSQVNNIAISIEKIGEDIRTDALRKRQERNKNNTNESQSEESPKTSVTKRRTIKNEKIKEETESIATKCDRVYNLRVSIGEMSFSRTFDIRTARDLNKYRYLRKCVELYQINEM